MSPLDDIASFASGIIARDVPVNYEAGPARAAQPNHPDSRLWAFTDHRTMAEVIAAEGGRVPQFREGALIDSRKTVFNSGASRSQRALAARVVARWGMRLIDAPSDVEQGGAA